MSKMDEMRKELDKESTFEPTPAIPSDKEINDCIDGEISRVYSEKVGIKANMKLAKKIIELNPDLPTAFKTKFEVMSINAHFATNISVVIQNCINGGIDIKTTEKEDATTKVEKNEDN